MYNIFNNFYLNLKDLIINLYNTTKSKVFLLSISILILISNILLNIINDNIYIYLYSIIKDNFIIFYYLFPLFQIIIILLKKNTKIKNFNNLIISIGFYFNFSLFILLNNPINNIKSLYFFNIKLNNNFFFNFNIAFDNLNIFFLILTNLIILLVILYNIKTKLYNEKLKLNLVLILIIFFILNNIFLTTNILIFYIFFELVLIPFIFLIAIWGSRKRKIHAALQFFIFTLTTSMLMLIALIYIYFKFNTTEFKILEFLNLNFKIQKIIWIFIFISLSAKIPIIPFHFWLPEAHVEAPTIGSVILAGILLKLGGYGFIKFLILYTPEATLYFYPIISIIGLIGLIYGSLSTLRQIDLKKIVAYSSIVHMNYSILGIFSNNIFGITGSYFLMLSHGLVASALFFLVGIIYERYHTRILKYYKGLVIIMPLYSLCFFFLTISNAGFPITSSFIGEFLIFLGIIQINLIISFFSSIGLIISGIYAFWLFTRLCFGNINNSYIKKYSDLNLLEFLILFILIFFILFLGIYSKFILDYYNLLMNHYILNFEYIMEIKKRYLYIIK